MSNKGYFNDLLGDGPELKTINYRGKEKQCYFRRITGAERIQLLKGQTMQAGGEGKPTFKIDLADSAERNIKLIAYSLCDEAGKAVYSPSEVRDLPDDLINVLQKHANEVNQEEEAAAEAGNA